MDHVQRFQVLHTGRYLSRHVDQTSVTGQQTFATLTTRLINKNEVSYMLLAALINHILNTLIWHVFLPYQN